MSWCTATTASLSPWAATVRARLAPIVSSSSGTSVGPASSERTGTILAAESGVGAPDPAAGSKWGKAVLMEQVFLFDRCELDLGTVDLRVDGRTRAVEPQVFDVLAFLVRHRDRLVPK